MEEIMKRLTGLKLEKTDPIAELGIKKVNVENKDAEEFLNQFSLYLDTWGEKGIQILSNKLEGVALNWFIGAKGQLLRNWSEFSSEFQDIFGTKEQKAEVSLMVELAECFRPEKILKLLIKAYALKVESKIDMKILISTA